MFIKWNHRIIFNYLKMLNRNITIIGVGHGKWNDLDSDKINYKYFDTLSRLIRKVLIGFRVLYNK